LRYSITIKTCSTCRLLGQPCHFPRIQEEQYPHHCTREGPRYRTRAHTGDTDVILSAAAASVRSIHADFAEGMGRVREPWYSLPSACCHGFICIYMLIAFILRCSARFALLSCCSTLPPLIAAHDSCRRSRSFFFLKKTGGSLQGLTQGPRPWTQIARTHPAACPQRKRDHPRVSRGVRDRE
jgi:hypothetical protein